MEDTLVVRSVTKMRILLLLGLFAVPGGSATLPERPLIRFGFQHDLTNSGSWGGEGTFREYATGEGPTFCRGVRGWGVSFAASSRGGGSSPTPAGGAVEFPAAELDGAAQVTLALWFLPRGPNAPARLLYFGPGWDLMVSGAQVTFKVRHAGTDQMFAVKSTEAATAAAEQWNFVAVAWDAAAGTAVCYAGGRETPARAVVRWTGIPVPDAGGDVLTIGNLGGIRPFRGLVDEVTVYNRVLDPEEVEALRQATCSPTPTLGRYGGTVPPKSLFDHTDVCFSTRHNRANAPAVWKQFGTTRLLWVYTTDAAYIEAAKASGIRSFQCAINSIERTDELSAYARDLEGRRLTAPWMLAFSKTNPPTWGCNNQPAYLEKCVEAATKSLDAGADWIQFDDWAMIVSAYAWGGGCFCDRCLDGFRKYLQARLSVEQATELGIADLAAFDYKTYLAARYHITTAAAYRERRREVPLEPWFRSFQRMSVRAFFTTLRKRLDAHAGRRVPLSINSTLMVPNQERNFLADIVDFFVGETWRPGFLRMTACCKVADALGKYQVFSPIPRDVQDTRRMIATAYALGHLPLVPWDIYMGSDATGIRPRYFGTSTEYGDLYRFVRDHGDLFDGCETPASVAVVANTDHYLADKLEAVCRILLENHVPFTFVLAGHSYYDSSLTAGQLSRFDTVVRVNPLVDFTASDQDALRKAGTVALVATPAELTPRFLAPLSLFTFWGPAHVYLLPRVAAEDPRRRLVVHVLNLTRTSVDNHPCSLKWTSVLVRSPAMLGSHLVSARWHTPGQRTVSVETESLREGIRVLLPHLDLWGVLELEFDRS